MPIFMLYRTEERQRNCHQFHAALVEAADAASAPAAARALVQGVPNDLFDDFSVYEVAEEPHADFRPTVVRGDLLNVPGTLPIGG